MHFPAVGSLNQWETRLKNIWRSRGDSWTTNPGYARSSSILRELDCLYREYFGVEVKSPSTCIFYPGEQRRVSILLHFKIRKRPKIPLGKACNPLAIELVGKQYCAPVHLLVDQRRRGEEAAPLGHSLANHCVSVEKEHVPTEHRSYRSSRTHSYDSPERPGGRSQVLLFHYLRLLTRNNLIPTYVHFSTVHGNGRVLISKKKIKEVK